MTVHLIHGFNVFDKGRGSINKLRPFLEGAGYDVKTHSYGWVFLLRLRFVNDQFVEKLLEDNTVAEGDIIICHSNGALITWRLMEKGIQPSKVLCIQPALRRDTLWNNPETEVYCFYNKKDYIVELGRLWGRFVSVVNPFKNRHGWGSAGRHGFSSLKNIYNINTGDKDGLCHAEGHGGFFDTKIVKACSGKILDIIEKG
jgi:hypothetical protein